MFSKRYQAFTLIEVMLVVLVIGVMAGLILPRVFKKAPASEWSYVREELNNLLYFARQESIARQKVYRLVFDAKSKEYHSVYVESEENDLAKPGSKKFVAASEPYFKAEYRMPQSIRIVAFYEGKVDVLPENKHKAYCYVVPDGLVSEAMIHVIRTVGNAESRGTFKILPFLGKFEYEENFVKPVKQKE